MTAQPLSLRKHRVRLAAHAKGYRAHENPRTGMWMLVAPGGIRPVDPGHKWGEYPYSITEIEDRLNIDRNARFEQPRKKHADE